MSDHDMEGVNPYTPYGFCPVCGSVGKSRERRPNGYDTCTNGHIYLSAKAMKHKPGKGDIDHKKMERAVRKAIEYDGDELEILSGDGYTATDVLRAYLDKCDASRSVSDALSAVFDEGER